MLADNFIFVPTAIVWTLKVTVGKKTTHFVFVQIAVTDIAFVVIIIDVKGTSITAIGTSHSKTLL